MIGDILQPSHLLFILVIALVVLGPKRLPEVGRALGRGLRDFRGALSGVDPREELTELGQVSHQPMTMPAPMSQPTADTPEPATETTPPPEPTTVPPPHDPAEHSG